jgi:hypothetical protein
MFHLAHHELVSKLFNKLAHEVIAKTYQPKILICCIKSIEFSGYSYDAIV